MTSRSRKVPQSGGEFRSGPVAGSTYVSGVTFARKSLSYAEVDGLAIFEGDIVLGSVADLQAPADAGIIQFSIGITGQQFRWPNAIIPYDIDPTMPNQQRITDAISHWEANTRIRFVLRTAANAAQYDDYAHFQSGGGCSSSVGRRGGAQNITLGNGCGTGNAIHEIGHTVGLWHEQSREDRDTFVQIVWANIDPAMQFNFSQQIADGDDLGAYDYGSIMHYPPTGFSINGQATIIALQPLPVGVVMGQRNGLSQGDIAGVHAMYPLPTFKEVPKDPITDPVTTFKEVHKDPITDQITIKELRKDPITDPVTTFKEVNKDPIVDPISIKEVAFDPTGTWVENVFTHPGQMPGFNSPQGASPFVMASPSRASNNQDALNAAASQVQELANALSIIEQQHTQLMAAYQAALQNLDALQRGQ
ncbi:MAG: M12 family metallopeptidase [Anaerolineae bacterium]|nr:M12 family metallopeptidase [Anaerolineae bacterium]